MSTAKHTAGSWGVYTFDQNEDHLIAIRSTELDRVVALVPTDHPIHPSAEDEALVKLIMAAPELLAACKALAQSLEYAIAALDAPLKSTMRENLSDAQAVITKAEGKASI